MCILWLCCICKGVSLYITKHPIKSRIYPTANTLSGPPQLTLSKRQPSSTKGRFMERSYKSCLHVAPGYSSFQSSLKVRREHQQLCSCNRRGSNSCCCCYTWWVMWWGCDHWTIYSCQSFWLPRRRRRQTKGYDYPSSILPPSTTTECCALLSDICVPQLNMQTLCIILCKWYI